MGFFLSKSFITFSEVDSFTENVKNLFIRYLHENCLIRNCLNKASYEICCLQNVLTIFFFKHTSSKSLSILFQGTVIIIANHGEKIDIPMGSILENKIVSGNLRILDH